VWRRVSKHEFFGRTVTLKVKYADFSQITRSRTPGGFVTEFNVFWDAARELLDGVDFHEKPVRLLGLSLGGARAIETPEVYQLEFDFPICG
jgi:DNA polymerase-4